MDEKPIYILNIESSSEVCSVNITKNNSIVAIREQLSDSVHAEKLSVFIQELFQELAISQKDLSAIAVSAGPGSYTGLRIGVSIAKGLCFPFFTPIISINSLLILKEMVLAGSPQFIKNTLLCPLIDARRMEVFCGLFNQEGDFIESPTNKILDNKSFFDILKTRKIAFFGSGAEKASQVITSENALFLKEYKTSSRGMVKLSFKMFIEKRFSDLSYFEPEYLKEAYTTTSSIKNNN